MVKLNIIRNEMIHKVSSVNRDYLQFQKGVIERN